MNSNVYEKIPKWEIGIQIDIEYKSDNLCTGYSLFRRVRTAIDKIIADENIKSDNNYKLITFSPSNSRLEKDKHDED